MTVHPIDWELWRETAASVRDDPYGITMSGGELLDILDAISAAEHRATRAEARIKAVQDVADGHRQPTDRIGDLHGAIRRALDGSPDGDPTQPCGRGPCCLGDRHAGDCRL